MTTAPLPRIRGGVRRVRFARCQSPEPTVRGRRPSGPRPHRARGLLAAAVVAGTVLGLVLDRAAGTEPAFTIAGVFLGIVAGGLGFWARVRAALK